jgi:lysophospholipid acyltransferase (LPLAT)-like uncharacterized protein
MKLTTTLLNKLAGLGGATLIRSWMATLDYRVAYYDPSIDPVKPDWDGQKIYIFWHEYILFPIYLRGHCHLTMLLSQHRDADVLSRVAHHLGFDFVRGSTTRGGATALRELLRKSQRMNLTITPDGPRGPRRQLAQGPIYLASKLRLPIVAMGFGYDRPWRLPSWDRFAVPRPGSRARAVVSPALHIPADLGRAGLESHRQRVERLLERLTLEAERWAVGGTRMQEEGRLARENAASRKAPAIEGGRGPAPLPGEVLTRRSTDAAA